jgi:hypothetical protein
MAEQITDFSLSVLRITDADHRALPETARALLVAYAARSWRENGVFAFEVASYRIPEIYAACHNS